MHGNVSDAIDYVAGQGEKEENARSLGLREVLK